MPNRRRVRRTAGARHRWLARTRPRIGRTSGRRTAWVLRPGASYHRELAHEVIAQTRGAVVIHIPRAELVAGAQRVLDTGAGEQHRDHGAAEHVAASRRIDEGRKG